MESGITHTNIQDVGTLTHTQLESNLTTVSGATVTNAADIVTVSGAGVVVSGATVTNAADIVTVSGAGVVVSGAGVTVSGAGVTVSGAGATHQADASDPHGATLIQTNISTTGLISGTTLTGVVGDHAGSESPELINVVYSTGSNPPTASNTTEGTLFVQYIA